MRVDTHGSDAEHSIYSCSFALPRRTASLIALADCSRGTGAVTARIERVVLFDNLISRCARRSEVKATAYFEVGPDSGDE